MYHLYNRKDDVKMDNIRVFLENRKKYEEGTLVGEWITLPIDFDEQAEFFERVVVEEDPCRDSIVTDYKTDLQNRPTKCKFWKVSRSERSE